MVQGKAFFYGLLAVTLAASSAALWQTLEVMVRDRALAQITKVAATARRDTQAATETAQAAERRARTAEADLQTLRQSLSGDAAKIESLTAELAAARQQLSVTETAVTEAEAQLSAEITAHAALKAKSAETAAALANTTSSIAPIKPNTTIAEPATAKPADQGASGPDVQSGTQQKASESAPKRTVTIEPRTEKRVQAKPTVKRATKTAKEPETKSFFPLF